MSARDRRPRINSRRCFCNLLYIISSFPQIGGPDYGQVPSSCGIWRGLGVGPGGFPTQAKLTTPTEQGVTRHILENRCPSPVGHLPVLLPVTQPTLERPGSTPYTSWHQGIPCRQMGATQRLHPPLRKAFSCPKATSTLRTPSG